MKRLLEMKLAIDMQNLEAFRKASRGMKKLMDYRMSKAVTKIVKTHKGTEKAKDNFIKMMENITSFSKLNIPLRTLKRMEQKGILVSQSPQNHQSFSKLDLRKTNPKLYKELKVKPAHPGRLQRVLPGEAAEARRRQAERRPDDQGAARAPESLQDARGVRPQDELRIQEAVPIAER